MMELVRGQENNQNFFRPCHSNVGEKNVGITLRRLDSVSLVGSLDLVIARKTLEIGELIQEIL